MTRMSPKISRETIERLTGSADYLFQTLVVVRERLSIKPDKEHISACINYTDLIEMRNEFIEELVHTIVPFVYSADCQRKIIERMNDDPAQAWSRLRKRARAKFRRSNLKGQFSELLLYNVLRHFFKAAPLVRKMPITTNVEVERHGADAIHIGADENGPIIYLGEAKTYDREDYGLRQALKDAISDVVEKHHNAHRRELNLYVYEDFLPQELESFAEAYLSGSLHSARVELVCLATYDHRRTISGSSREALIDATLQVIREDVGRIRNDLLLDGVPEPLIPRLNYVLFGVSAMRGLIDSFARELGT